MEPAGMKYPFEPMLCGSCPCYAPIRRIEPHGEQAGYCYARQENVCRTDWCHNEAERAEHRRAMQAYTDKQKKE